MRGLGVSLAPDPEDSDSDSDLTLETGDERTGAGLWDEGLGRLKGLDFQKFWIGS